MDRLGAMRVYVAVVEQRGFSAAARTLGMPVPTVCRKIAELEDQVGAQLLVRSTRRVSVTDSGQIYYDDARGILEDVDAAERRASGEYQFATGLLTITAPSMFGRLHLLPVISEFMRIHEEIEIRLLLTNHVLDFPDSHIDLGVRIGGGATASMDSIELGSVRQVVCAGKNYLAEHDCPAVPRDIAGHDCVTFSRSGSQVSWLFGGSNHKPLEIPVNSRFVVNTAEAALDAVLKHGGFTQLYAYQAAHLIQSGELQIVLENFEIEPRPVAFNFQRSDRLPQKLRTFVDFASPKLQQQLLDIARICAT